MCNPGPYGVYSKIDIDEIAQAMVEVLNPLSVAFIDQHALYRAVRTKLNALARRQLEVTNARINDR